MKRIFAVLMVLALCGMASGILMESGTTTPSIKVVMRSSAGASVTGLTFAAFNVFVTESLAAQVEFDDDEATNDVVAIAAADTAYGGARTTIGVVEIGNGVYRVDLPATLVDSGAGKYVSLAIVDNTAAALNAYVLIELTPSVNTVLANGTTAPTIADVVDGVWDELVVDHTTTGTYGLQVGTSGGMVAPPGDIVTAGTAQGGSTNYITLAAADDATIDFYKGYSVRVVDVTDGFIAVRAISSYDNATKRAYVTPNWIPGREPTSDNTYTIGAPSLPGGPVGTSNAAILTGTARDVGGTGSTTTQIQLAATVSGVPETYPAIYNGYMVRVSGGTGAGQTRKIVDYSGHIVVSAGDNVCKVWPPFDTAPDATSTYELVPGPSLQESFNSIATVTASTSTKRRITVTGFGYLPSDEKGRYGTVYYIRGSVGSTVRFISQHICLDAGSAWIDIFPALNVDPTDYDYVVFSPTFGGLIPADIPSANDMYFDNPRD